MSVKKHIVSFALFLSLMGCNEELTPAYLIQHPEILQQKINSCQLDKQKSLDEIKQCRMIMAMATKLQIFIEEQGSDPEEFGEKLLALQKNLAADEQALGALKAKNAPADKVNEAKNIYDEKRNEIAIMLAVIGMNSPE